MSTTESLLSNDAVFVVSVLFHSRGENGIGRFRLQKIGYLSYVKLPSSVKDSVRISYDTSWVGRRDLTVDRVLSWLIQSQLAVKHSADVFGDEYTHAYQLSYDGVDAYTQLGNTDHVLTRNIEQRVDTDVVLEINGTVKETVNQCRDMSTGELLNVVAAQTDSDKSELTDLFK